MTTFRKLFAARLKELRTAADISQEKFAELLGVAPKTVSYWENGHNAVNFDKLPKIAEVLQVPVFQLFVIAADLVEGGNSEGVVSINDGQ